MQEGQINLPTHDNNGNSLVHLQEQVIRDVVAAFGGCSIVDAEGAWVSNDGTLYREPVKQIVTAYEPSPETDAKLRHIAVAAGLTGFQLAMYVRYANGTVEIIDLTDQLSKAA